VPGTRLCQESPREFQSLQKISLQVTSRRGAARRLSLVANERSMVSVSLEVSRENTDWCRGCRRRRFPVVHGVRSARSSLAFENARPIDNARTFHVSRDSGENE